MTHVSKQGNSVYSLGKWVCFFKMALWFEILVQKPDYSVLAIEKNCITKIFFFLIIIFILLFIHVTFIICCLSVQE